MKDIWGKTKKEVKSLPATVLVAAVVIPFSYTVIVPYIAVKVVLSYKKEKNNDRRSDNS